MLTTASLAVSRHMLHSKFDSALPPPAPASFGVADEVDANPFLLLFIFPELAEPFVLCSFMFRLRYELLLR